MRLLRILAVLALLTAMTAAAEAKPLRIMLQWTHQAQFAGYYVALEKGFYREHGIEVEIVSGGPGREPAEFLRRGEVDFASLWLSSALIRSAKGESLLQVAQIVNASNMVLIARHQGESGDVSVLSDRRISLWEGDFRAPYQAWLQANGIQAKIYPQYYSVNLFLHRGVDACAAMNYNELHMLFQTGLEPGELLIFPLRDYGFGFPEDGIYTTKEFFRTMPEYVSAFRSATLAGWRYAAAHQDEALDIVMTYVDIGNVPTNRPHMKWMLEKMLASIMPGAHNSWSFGKLSRNDFQKTVDTLKQQGLLEVEPDYHAFIGEEPDNVP